MKNIFKNKNGALAFDWIYGLSFLICLGLLYVVFNQAITNHIVPAITDTIPNSFAGKSDIVQTNNEWLSYWNAIPIAIFLFILTYWFVSAIKQGNQNNVLR